MRKLSLFLLVCLFCMASCNGYDDDGQVGALAFPKAEYGFARTVLMCEPGEEFDFAGSSKDGALSEHRALANILRQEGIEVLEMRPSVREYLGAQSRDRSIVYVRDPILCTPSSLVVGRMSNELRSAEPEQALAFLRKFGQMPVYRIHSEGAVLEGGDYFPFGNLCFIGCGLRTNQEAVDELMKADVLGADSIVVIRDRWHQQREMHLDTYLNIIDRDLMTLTCDRFDATPDDGAFLTADVYVRRAGFGNYDKVLADTPLLGFLQGLGVEVLRIGKYDTATLGGNFLCIAPRHIIASDDLSEAFVETLRRHRVAVESSPAGNLRTGGGSIHCATQVISRK